MRAILAALVFFAAGLSLYGCATPGDAFARLEANPAGVCQKLPDRTPGPEGYLDQVLAKNDWFTSSVKSVSFHVAQGSSAPYGEIFCPATLLLADGSTLTGTFNVLYNLEIGGLPTITWQSDPASEQQAEKRYLVAKWGAKKYEQAKLAHEQWDACVDAPHGLDPRPLSGEPVDAPLWVLNDDMQMAQMDATLEACGYPPKQLQ